MPIRKINTTKFSPCFDLDHEPPTHMVFEPGMYEHTCPSCKRKIVFTTGFYSSNNPVHHTNTTNLYIDPNQEEWQSG